MMKKIPELLSPAGGLEQLKAAVENGADAVYMGGRLFNARVNAENFDDHELKAGMAYAHIRGVNVYVAMNTLIADEEMQAALEFAAEVYEAGADALIIQDMGFAGLVKKHLPDLPIHLSTQATIYNIEGVRAAEKLGFSRVILARELDLASIKNICDQTSVQIEVFVHGALCMSYSGQCQLSQVIGGRSGNRGQCAQPCRLPYSLHMHEGRNDRELTKAAYLLSPKDLWAIKHLDQLAGAGVSSLKIEGRMKSPEYVATVTGIYRKYLELYAAGQLDSSGNSQTNSSTESHYEVTAADIKALKQSYNRGGFTTGYFLGNPGRDLLSGKLPKHQGVYIGTVNKSFPERRLLEIKLEDRLSIGDGIEIWSENFPGNLVTFMKKNAIKVDFGEQGDVITVGDIDGEMMPGDLVYKITDKQLNKEAQASYLYKPEQRVMISCLFEANKGRPMALLLTDDEGHEVHMVSEHRPEDAINRATTKEMIVAQLDKTGGTPYKIIDFKFDVAEGIAIPMSEINLLRRNALEELTRLRLNKYPEREKPMGMDAKLKIEVLELGAKTGLVSPTVNKILYFYPLNGSKSYQLVNKNFEEHIFEASRIYLPYSCFLTRDYDDIFEAYGARKIPLIPVIPPITFGYHDMILAENLETLIKNPFVSGICLGNLGWAAECLKLGADIYGDYSLNFYNSNSFSVAKSMGFKGGVIAHEASLSQIKDMDFSGLDVSVAAYGRLPVMITEHCPIGSRKTVKRGLGDPGNTDHCANTKSPNDIESGNDVAKCNLCHSGSFYLKDRKGAEFPVITDKDSCRATILSHNTRPLKYTSTELVKAGIMNQRLYILDETIGDIEGL